MRARVFVAVAVGVFAACTTDTTVGPKKIVSLTVFPDTGTLLIGDTLRLQVIATDDRGVQFIGLPARWSSSNAAAASIGATGELHAVSLGAVTITAQVQTHSATAQFNITPPPAFSVAADTIFFTATANGPAPAQQHDVITNSGGGTLTGVTDTISYGAGAVDWLTTSLSGATAPDTLQITVTNTSFPAGTYYATVSLKAPKATNSPKAVIVKLTLGVGAPTQIAADSGDQQTASAHTDVAIAPSVIVRDQYNNPVPGVSVTFAPVAGSGTVTGGSPTTDANGRARVGSWQVGTAAGTDTLIATAVPLPGSPVSFTATVTAAAAGQIQRLAGDSQTTTVGGPVPVQPQVLVKDAFGNPVPNASVTFAVASGGGSVSGGSQNTDAAGIAIVGGWTLGTTAGTNTLSASVGAVTTTFTATGTAGAAAQIAAFAGDGQTATVNTAVATAPAVRITDQFNNPVAGTPVVFTIGSGGSIAGGNAASDSNGVAAVGSWTLGTTAGANTLLASSGGLSGSPVTFTATGTAGTATQLAVNGGNGQTAAVNTAVATAPSVIVRDQFGNPVAGVTVTFTVTSGGGSLTGASPVTTAGGIATVGSWTLGTSAGANGLSASAGALTPVAFTATATPAAASQIAKHAGDAQSAIVNTTVGTPPQVLVSDQFSNPVAGVSVTFTVASGGGSITGPTTTTNASGIATVGSWKLGTAAGANTLSASASGVAGSVTFTATGTAGAATQIAKNAGDGQTAAVNTNVAVAPRVIVTDQFSNPVAGTIVTFAVASGGGGLTKGTDTTDAAGLAQVGSWTLGTSAGANSLTATSVGLSGSPLTFTATATTGSATQIAKNAGDAQTATVNTNLATAPSVIVKDQFGNSVAGVGVTFAVPSGGGSITGAAATSNASGIATVGSWKLGTAAGANTLTATSTGLTGSPLIFTATGTAGAATTIVKNAGDAQSATVNTAVTTPPRVLVTDGFGNSVAGTIVTFAVATGGGSLTKGTDTTDAAGLANVGSWTLGTTAGANTLTATASGLTGSPLTFTATGSAGAATQLAKSAGDAQTAPVNTAVTTPPAVIARDQFNNPAAGAIVTFAVASGGGSVVKAVDTTDATGIANVTSWTLGANAGANSLTATSTGLTGSPLTFTATATAGSATQIAVNAGDGQSATVNSNVATAPSVIVKDQFGNPVSGVSVTFAVASGGGSITGAATTSNASGIATVGSWKLGTAAGTNTLTATSSGLTGSPVTFTATATAAAAKTIALNAGNGQSATVNTNVATAPAVFVSDTFGNPVAGVTVTFAVATGGGSVAGGTQPTNASGIATVGSWTLGTAIGSNTLTATAAGLSGSPVTFTATGTAGAATQLALSAGDGQTATVNTAVTTPPRVIARDQFSNPAPGAIVTFAVASGGGSLVKAIDTTDAAGIANVGSWTLGATAGSNTMTATATGLSGSPVTFTATGTAAGATQIALNAGDGQVGTVNQNVGTAPSVIVKDQFNNPVQGVSVTFAVASGGGSVTAATPTTNASGIATLGSWRLGTTAGTNTLTATSGSLTGSPVTFTATAVATAAKTIVLNAGNGQSATVNTNVATAPSVAVSDSFGNAVAGVTVTFAVATGGGSVAGGSQPTNGGGIATVGSWTLGTTAGSNTLTATSAGLTGSPVTFTATGTAGAATQLALNAGNGQTATVNTNVATAPSVIARDQFNNAAAGAIVTFAVASGGGSVVKAIDTTDATGIANVTSWKLGTTAGSNSLTATSGSLTGSPVTFTATGSADVANQIAVSAGDGQSALVNSDVAVPPTVIVKDQFGNPVAGTIVTFAVASGGGSLTKAVDTTDAAGLANVGSWTLGAVAGANTMTATATGLSGSPVTFTATGQASTATTIALLDGNSQTDTIGATLPAPYRVVVTDGTNPVSGVTVNWAVTVGGGSIPASSVTNASGIATATHTFGLTAGAQTATASVGGLTGSPVTFTSTANAGNAKTIALNGGNTQTDTIGATLPTAYTVLVTDRGGNPVNGITVTWAAGGGVGTITPSSNTNASGIATATRMLGNPLGSQTATATAGGLTGSPVNFTATATHGNAKTIALNGGDAQTDTVGKTLPVAYTVLVTDRLGNPVPSITVTWAVVTGGGSITPSSITNGSGIAAATRVLGGATGSQTATATVAGLTGSPVTFTATALGGSATTIALFSGNGQTDTIGAMLGTPYAVKVTDGSNNPVSGVAVTWAVTGGGGSILPLSSFTNGVGIATATHTFGTTAGAQTASADVSGLTGSPVTFTSTASAGNAKTIALAGGDAQTDTIGATLPTAYTVLITDRGANPVNNVTVTWAAIGGGSITPSSNTNASGIATAARVLGTTAGSQTATATASGLTGSPVNFTATATHGNAKTIALNGGDAQTDTVGKTLAVPYSVLVTDRAANPVPSVTVTWAAGGGGSITPSSITNGSGIAAATRVLGNTAGTQTATATVGGLTGSPVTFTATAVNAAASAIALFAGNGQTDTIGAALATAYQVKVTDASNNPVAGITVTWAVTGGGGSIPASSITNGSGIASATHTLGTTAGTQTATADVTGLAGTPVTFTSTATHGNATTIALDGGNAQTDTIGATLAAAYTVLVTDRGANPVNNVSVTWAAGGGGSITPSSNTNASGIASATRVLGTTAGTQTATATVGGLIGSPVNFTATASHGNATTIALNGGDSQTDTIGATLPLPYTVLVTDRAANPVNNITVTWAAGGGGSITPSSNTNASGIAAATRVLGTTAGTQTATATVGGLIGSPVNFTATATAGGAATIALNGGDAQTDTIGATVAPLSVIVKDAGNNPVNNVTVTWNVTSANGSITPTSNTNAGGIASASLTFGDVSGALTATASVSGLAGSPVGFAATITHGHETTIALAGGNTQTDTIDAVLATPYSVAVTDRGGNPVAGVSVTWAATSGGGSITSPSITNGSGIATATRTLGSAIGTDSATATAGGLTGSPVGFAATAVHGNAASIVVNGGDAQTDTIGATLATYTVLVKDRANNVADNVTVNWTAGGGGSITASSFTNGSGIAAATRVLGTTAGTQTAQASTAGVVATADFTATATHGAAKTIALNGGNSQTDTVAATLGTAYTVLVTDRGGNAVNNVTVTWAASVGSITASSLTNGSGIASATRTLGTSAGTQTATATVAGLTGSPVNFSATANAANAKNIAANSSTTLSGTVNTLVSPTPSVVVTDQFGNAKSGITVTFAVGIGGGSATAPTTPATNALGVATVGGWTLGTTAGTSNNTMTASAGGLTGSPVTFTASAAAGAVSVTNSLVSATSPITASTGSSLSTVTITVRDAFSNPISGKSVTLAVSGSGNTVNQPASATNASGQTTGSFRSTVAETKTVTASVTGTGALSQQPSVVVNPDVVSLSVSTNTSSAGSITACSVSCTTGGGTAALITVTVKDQFGNVISGKTVTPSSTGTSNTFNPTTGTTNGSGVFTSTFNSTKAEGKTISAAVTGSGTLTATAGVTVNAAAAASIAVNGGSGQFARIGTAVATAPSAIVRDAFSNPKSGVTVTFSVSAGGGSLTSATPVTNASGIATVGSWTLGGTGSENPQGGSNPGTTNNTLGATASGAGSTSFSGFGFYILSSDVQPIFTASCALSGCHLASVHPFLSSSGTSFSETVGVVASCDGAKFRINPSFASTSVLYLRVSTTTECSGAMPPSASVTMTAANQQKIRMWINRGAANN